MTTSQEPVAQRTQGLMLVWLFGCLPIWIILAILSQNGALQGRHFELWGMFTPLWLPTLTHLISQSERTLFTASSRRRMKRPINTIYGVTAAVATVYLLAVAFTAYLIPHYGFQLQAMGGAMCGLGVACAIVTGLIGLCTKPKSSGT